MKQTNNKQWIKNFLISKSFLSLTESANRLSFVAKQSYFARDYEDLTECGNQLINLSPKTESLGRYYLALAQSRYWSNDHENVKTTFEDLAENELSFIRAASLLALGGERLLNGKTDDTTAKFFVDSCSIALENNYPLTFVQSQSALSLLYSLNQEHVQSLQILRGLKPAIDRIGSLFLTTDYYNSVAFELLQLEQREVARFYASYVLKSPHLSAYPEWQKNLNEIFVKEDKVSIAFSEPLPPKAMGKLLRFKLKPPVIRTVTKTPLFIMEGLKFVPLFECTDDDLAAITTLMDSRRKQQSQQSAETI